MGAGAGGGEAARDVLVFNGEELRTGEVGLVGGADDDEASLDDGDVYLYS